MFKKVEKIDTFLRHISYLTNTFLGADAYFMANDISDLMRNSFYFNHLERFIAKNYKCD